MTIRTSTAPDTTSSDRRVASVARMVAAGLERTDTAMHAIPYSRTEDAAEHLRRAEQMAHLYARRVRWWVVLERATIADHTIPPVYLRALVSARCGVEGQVREWEAIAERWSAHLHNATTGPARLLATADAPAVQAPACGVVG